MSHLIKTIALACVFVVAVGCDKLSPFISDKQFEKRLDLDDDGVPNVEDCDPNDPNISKLTFYRDLDGDGYGSKESKLDCLKSKGFVEKTGDCDDENDKVYPDAVEVCDLIDNDCDSKTDENVTPRWYRDKDEDKFGSLNDFRDECSQPIGYIAMSGDCDDDNDKVYPNATEACDLFDNDCDGKTDENLAVRWYLDKDNDKHGDANVFEDNCKQLDGYILTSDDCDDDDSATYPEAEEICDDKIDQDCDGITDNAESAKLWFADEDEDGSGNSAISIYACVQPNKFVSSNDDCDDGNSKTNPNVTETCEDGIDNDCDGVTDSDAEYFTWYNDVDKDGFGNSKDSTTSCVEVLDGYVKNADDCDDELFTINPAVEETCNNGFDDNCNNSLDGCELIGTISLTNADSKFTGKTDNDNAGWSVAGVGDVNDDGVDDLAIGAPGDDDGGPGAGAVYVLYGPLENGNVLLVDADLKLTGEIGDDNAGWSVAGVGDVNDDGVDDLAIGAPGDDDGGSGAGAVHVLYGPLSSGNISLSDADIKLTGEIGDDNAGWSVAGVGDVNDDGVDDLAIGAPGDDDGGSGAGAVYVLYGPLSSGKMSLTKADLKLTGKASADYVGWNVAGVGDVNDDGVDDLAIGAIDDDDGSSGAGAVYVLYGPLENGNVSLTKADLKLTGTSVNDNVGRSVAKAGDLNHDGIDDLAIGATGDDDGGSGAGAVYVLYGPLASGNISLANANLKLTGEAGTNYAGWSIAGAGDLNHDGIDDLAISAFKWLGESGAVYVLYGPLTTGKISLANANIKFTGETNGDLAGCSIALSDLNDDEFYDIVVGAYQNDSSGSNAGSAYIFYGLGY
ncbi:FG-GAP repeat protein [Candidatus Uhrbacteria bacterium]|nr:FG-GAP repeat protein [Candidatus Uhrbacteria bacterium]